MRHRMVGISAVVLALSSPVQAQLIKSPARPTLLSSSVTESVSFGPLTWGSKLSTGEVYLFLGSISLSYGSVFMTGTAATVNLKFAGALAGSYRIKLQLSGGNGPFTLTTGQSSCAVQLGTQTTCEFSLTVSGAETWLLLKTTGTGQVSLGQITVDRLFF